jgi:hypothetical protein
MTTNKAPAVAEARSLLQARQREVQETEQVRRATGEPTIAVRVVRRSLCLRRWKGEGP